MPFGAILEAAWKATWKYRAMWLLGMAVIGGGASSYLNIGNVLPDPDSESVDYETQAVLDGIGDVLEEYALLFILIGACLALFLLLAYLFHYVATAGLIAGAAEAEQGKPARFWFMCKVGAQSFLPVFGASILFGLVTFIFIAFVIILIVALGITIIGLIVAIPLALVFLVSILPLSWAVATLYQFTLRGIVLDHLPVFISISQAWQLLRAQWKNPVLACVTVWIWSMVVGMVTLAVAGMIGLPLVIFGYLAYTSQAWIALWLIAVVGFTVIVLIAFLLKGISQSFSAHLWHGVYASCRKHSTAGIAQR